jgi:hypothetical protein
VTGVLSISASPNSNQESSRVDLRNRAPFFQHNTTVSVPLEPNGV